jgi:AcrR family transcriptional regulator
MGRDKRSRLLEAAESVFVERGIAAATIDEITARAGVAKGTFYLYFKSKDDLVAALQRRLWAGHVAIATAAADEAATGDWWATVDELIEQVIDYDLEHREWHRLVGQSPSPLGDEEQAEEEMIALVTAAIEVGLQRGVCHTQDPELTATLLYRAVQGASHQWCLADEPPDRERMLTSLRELTRKALAATEP